MLTACWDVKGAVHSFEVISTGATIINSELGDGIKMNLVEIL
jgi:hypothetical protein